jgi:hypothetical protein
MSSILEALKKLDRERTERKNVAVNIEEEILKSPSSGVVAKSRYRALLLLLAGSVIVLLALLIFIWWRPFTTDGNSRENIAVRQKVPALDASKTGRMPIPSPTSQPSPVEKKEQASVPPAPERKTDQKVFHPTKEPPIQPRPVRPLPAPEPKTTAVVPARPDPGVKSVVPTPTPAPRKKAKPAVRPLPSLSVSGIAFREDRSSRLAIINGEAVGIGEKIEGAKVVDIMEEKIHFIYHGRKFTLGIGERSR